MLCKACHSEFHTYEDPCPEIESFLLYILNEVKVIDTGRLRDIKLLKGSEITSLPAYINSNNYYICIYTENGCKNTEEYSKCIESLLNHPGFRGEIVGEEEKIDYYFDVPQIEEVKMIADGTWRAPNLSSTYRIVQINQITEKINIIKNEMGAVEVLLGRLRLSLSLVEEDS